MPPALAEKPKRIIFNDDGDEVQQTEIEPPKKKKKKIKSKELTQQVKEEEDLDAENEYGEDDYFAKRDKLRRKQKGSEGADEAQKLWFNVYPQYPVTDEILDIKEKEQMELHNLCKSSFQSELTSTYSKRNPTDARWLQTALQRGTAKDRANAGALLVTSNPLGNLDALNTLISFTKPSNKSCTDVINILTDLWKEVLLPPHRKLLSIQMRGADWKLVRKDNTISKEKQKRIYAHWHFESELKELYFEFLKNMQLCMQTGQENAKNTSIVASSHLLAFAPEKEQMLLTMVVNKLGDPLPKIASKALHHLTDVAHKHPNMCGEIVKETEKLLFRNNISDRAQHFALCFLSSIAPAGRPEVCTKLVNICFSLFKVLVQKGAVNNHTMQAILRCLQKAILEAKPASGSTEILSKEMQDTIYRLVHLADIRISVQTLGLLLQLITVNTEKSDRFYNALYKKLLDLELTNIGTKTAAQLLHIIHRAIHIDANVQRAEAFIKRLLQISLYMPPNIAAGCLIVIHKLLRMRKELLNSKANDTPAVTQQTDLSKFDSDGEEKYEDVDDEKLAPSDEQHETNANEESDEVSQGPVGSSWNHFKVKKAENDDGVDDGELRKVREIAASKYDPYHRVPTFAGAEFTLRNELLLLREHYHPTVQVFADNILNKKKIDYYGDPLRDFGLPHFLERFAFKNPKKLDNKSEKPAVAHRAYVAYGTRGKPVTTLTAATCTEDEMYIFNFLEQKREQSVVNAEKKAGEEETKDGLKADDVSDDEFEAYLDGFFGKKSKGGKDSGAAVDEADDDDELDFLKELGGELKADAANKKSKKKSSKKSMDDDNDEDEIDDIDADWGDEDEDNEGQFEGEEASDDEEDSIDAADDDDDDDDDASISLDEENMEDDSDGDSEDGSHDGDEDDDGSDEEMDGGKNKKSRKNAGLDGRSFAKKLKNSTDMNSLFAAADDFSELLEETGKTKGQGTANAVFNRDKSSDKQLKWEEKRRSNSKTYTKRGGNKHFSGGGGAGSKKRKR